jgi:RimJ/RimL family protein N-acetyltransferase
MTEAPPEVLEVPRGRLSRIRESDADQLAQAVAASLDHLRPWMPWATKEAAEAHAQRERCRDVEKSWDEGTEYVYGLRPEPSGPVIGCFGLHRRIGPGAIEIGYWVHVDFAGRGYASACAGVLTHAALDLPDIAQVEIHTDEANTISAAIPRRLGYRLDRIDERPPSAPAESGRLQIWVMERPATSPPA